MSENFVTLSTLAKGAVPELFQEELRKVLENIADVNTDAERKREIVIRVSIVPGPERETGQVDVAISSKLAGVKKASSVIFMGRHHNEPVALESDPKQRGLFEERAPITSIDGGKA